LERGAAGETETENRFLLRQLNSESNHAHDLKRKAAEQKRFRSEDESALPASLTCFTLPEQTKLLVFLVSD
jgi:hypothetical protein